MGRQPLWDPFVFTGFKPAVVFIDTADGSNTEIGLMYDNIATYGNNINPISYPIETGVGAVAATGQEIDFLSNGFKIRTSDGGKNNVNKYIYAAFAEAPFVNSNGVPCNAR